MHMEYRVKLPDHDFVMAKRHKLIPSVYAFCEVKSNGYGDRSAVTYSGPTYIAIRSAKHSSSTAYSHARDMEQIFDNVNFDKFTHTKKEGIRTTKPILINVVDGGPDENVRYDKVQQMYINHFVKYDLDAVFVASNAPGRSAFNRVERRMAPLSKGVVGVVLPYDHYGSHLDNNGQTTNIELEKENFCYAGKALAEIWSEMEIDGFLTQAEYIDPGDSSDIQISSLNTKDTSWKDRHVFQSQYLLQILKCEDELCCGKRRSSIFSFLPKNGLPYPIPLKQSDDGLKISKVADIEKFASLFITLGLKNEALNELTRSSLSSKWDRIPYDAFCSSVQSKIERRLCSCGKYFSSITSLKAHSKVNKSCRINVSSIKASKILAVKENEKLVIVEYDDEIDVEWVYDMDLDEDLETFVEPEVIENEIYGIDIALSPVWEDIDNLK